MCAIQHRKLACLPHPPPSHAFLAWQSPRTHAPLPPPPSRQTIRFNEYNAERMRKAKAGEPIPANVNAQIKSGELKVPWTNVGQ